MRAELAGAAAGFIATAPMTAVMEGLHRMLPEAEQYPLPPREIVDNALEKADATGLPGVSATAGEHDRADLALAAHFAFGALAGTAYGAIARTRPPHPVLSGIGFGLMVWTSQYLGVLPAAGLLSTAARHPARRNAVMIAAHVVWGGTLGVLADRFATPDRPRPLNPEA